MSVGTNIGAEKVAIYARLSAEDIEKDNDGSRSIGNQVALLKDYCVEHGYTIYDTYIDDGISGTERNRPDFQRMLRDCEDGNIDIVICKDQSRFSRDDTVIKEYLHEKFFIWHVRFIGVSDNVDSESPDFMDNSSLRGFFNEWYHSLSKQQNKDSHVIITYLFPCKLNRQQYSLRMLLPVNIIRILMIFYSSPLKLLLIIRRIL